MCNRAACEKDHGQLIEELSKDFFRVTEEEVSVPRRSIQPHGKIPIIRNTADGYQALDAEWGFPFKGFSWNARDDRLDTSPAWAPLAGTSIGHCIVVVTHPMEPFGEHALQAIGEDACRKHVGVDAVEIAKKGGTAWHALPRVDGKAHLIPGLVTEREGKLHCSMITTKGGPVFSQLHRPKANPNEAREIVSLRSLAEAKEFMAPEDNPDWRALFRPADENWVSWYRVHPDATKRGSEISPFKPYKVQQAGLDLY